MDESKYSPASLVLRYLPELADPAAKIVCESAANMLLAIPVQVVIGYVRPNQNDLARRMTATLGMSFAVLWLLLSGSAGVIMLQKPGKDYRKAFDEPPYWTWWTATGLVFLQLYVTTFEKRLSCSSKICFKHR